jgi:hypothetical protein
MHCACRGQQTPSPQPDKSLNQATFGLNDHPMCWPVSPSTMSFDARRRLWIQHKLRENRLRHLATRQDLQPRKWARPHTGTPGSTAYQLATVTPNASSHDCDLRIDTTDNMTLEKVNNYLMDDATLAEVMNYLTGTYGPGLIEELIKHLPHLRPR